MRHPLFTPSSLLLALHILPFPTISVYLGTLCDYVYDDLCPRILHKPCLESLCEVCTVLQALMMLDVPSLSSEEGSPSGSSRLRKISRVKILRYCRSWCHPSIRAILRKAWISLDPIFPSQVAAAKCKVRPTGRVRCFTRSA